jgi:hypothetical protein
MLLASGPIDLLSVAKMKTNLLQLIAFSASALLAQKLQQGGRGAIGR